MSSVLVTRPAGRADRLVALLEAHGLRVHAVPTVAVAPLADPTELDAAVASLGSYGWLVLTSPEAVRVLAQRRSSSGPGVVPPRPKLAAVGPATAAEIRAHGLEVDLVALTAGGPGLARDLAREDLPGARVLLLRSAAADDLLPITLRAVGATVDDIAAYRTLEAPESSWPALRTALEDPTLACVIVASGSAVRGLRRLASYPTTRPVVRVPLVAFGPETAAEARRLGFFRVHSARTPTTEGVLEVVRELLQHQEEGIA